MKPNLLTGVRVVDFTTYVAAPCATKLMADWGAEVIKVEGLTGDPFRSFGASMGMPYTEDENALWEIENGNKKAVAINLKDPKGMEFMHKLLADADVFVSNVRLGSLEKMGLGYDALHAKYPKLVWTHLSGFGVYGEEAPRPGYDVVSFWSRGGQMLDLAPKGTGTIMAPYGTGDHTSGLVALAGTLAALQKAKATGEGSRINCSLMASAMWVSGMMLMSTQYGDEWPKDRYMPSTPLSTTYGCADGEYITLTVLDFARYFGPFVEALEMDPAIAQDPRFNTVAEVKKPENLPVLVKMIEEAFMKKPSTYWKPRLLAADLAFEVARHFKDLPYDKQAIANNYSVPFTCKNGKELMLISSPVQIDVNEPIDFAPAPLLGEHTVEYLKAYGYSDEEIKAMIEGGAVK